MSAEELVRLIRQAAPAGDDTVRLATVATVVGTSATVTFDGESVATVKAYPCVSYSPTVGQRVALARAGSGWVILGAVGAGGGSAHDHNAQGQHHYFADTRNTNPTPQQFDDAGLDQTWQIDFKAGTAIGLPSPFYGVWTMSPWRNGDTGGGMTQVAYGGSGIHTRYGTRTGGWGVWVGGGDRAWNSVTYLNGWSWYGAGYHNASYLKDSDGFVHFRGLIKGGNATAAFQLPVGYRTGVSGNTHLLMRSNSGPGLIFVDGSGNVTPEYDATAGWVDLASVTPFRAEA